MATIDSLSTTKSLSELDKIPIYSGKQRDTRSVSLRQMALFIRDLLEGTDDETVYDLNAVNGGFSVAALPVVAGAGVWVQITLNAPAATGLVILPGPDDRAPDQEVLVTSTQAIGSLTVSGSGATVSGAPATLAANGFFRLRFDNISSTWYRVG